MKELVAETQGRHFYADDFLIAQVEALEPLQELLSNTGSFVISGCEVAANVGTPGTFDISAGIVAIRHADGFKIARFDGDTALTLPGIMTIDKTTQTGNYGQPGSIVVKDISNTYKAVYTFSPPVANDDTELVVPDPPAAAKRLNGGLQHLTNSAKQTFNISSTDAEGYVNIVLNRAARLMYINGSIEFKNVAAWSFAVTEIELVANAVLLANTVIQPDIDAAGFKMWQGKALHSTGVLPEGTGGHPISSVNIKLTNSTIIAEARKTVSGAGYFVYFNEVLTLDV